MSTEAVPLVQARRLPVTTAEGLTGGETRIGVDHERMLYAARDAGVTRWQLFEASLHFSDQNQERMTTVLGVLDSNGGLTKAMRRHERQVKHVEAVGIHPDQFGDVYALAVNTPHYSAIRPEIYAAMRQHASGIISERHMQNLTEGDLVGSLLLAHELHHVAQCSIRNRLFQVIDLCRNGPLFDREAESFSYTARCLERGANNPWLGIVHIG